MHLDSEESFLAWEIRRPGFQFGVMLLHRCDLTQLFWDSVLGFFLKKELKFVIFNILSHMKHTDFYSLMLKYRGFFKLVGSRFIVEVWLQHFKATKRFHESFFLKDSGQKEILKNIYISTLSGVLSFIKSECLWKIIYLIIIVGRVPFLRIKKEENYLRCASLMKSTLS